MKRQFTVLLAVLITISQPVLAQNSAKVWFDKIDGNSDAKVSKTEFLKMWSDVFTKLDSNNDKQLTLEEWTKPNNKSDSKSKAVFYNADTNSDGNLSVAEHVALRTKHFNATDADQDGSLVLKEMAGKAAKK